MRITCPGCGKPFDTDARSGEVACTHCGEKLRAEAFGPTEVVPPPEERVNGTALKEEFDRHLTRRPPGRPRKKRRGNR